MFEEKIKRRATKFEIEIPFMESTEYRLLLLLLLLYTTFVKRIIHKLMCSNALSIQ